jgi:beta-galactosidase/beta-glucuronidase
MVGVAHPTNYPRPQLVRGNWTNLNGKWDFVIDPQAQWLAPEQVSFKRKIVVPYAPETPASGVEDTGFYHACWYRRGFDAPDLEAGQRLLLHFGAVDWEAWVWVNGKLAVHHEGGYTPFHADITDLLVASDQQTIVVRAHDDPHDLAKPRGKQDWMPQAHSIWYWRTTGIWQTVWMEVVPSTHLSWLRWTPHVERWELRLEARTAGRPRDDLFLRLRLYHRDAVIVDDTYALPTGQVDRRIGLPDPGIDDYRNQYLWSPSCPNLFRAELELLDRHGGAVDRVESYCALRSVAIQGNRFVLNTRPCYLRMVLDQGYWAETGLTPPDDEALRTDVERVKAMGFNGVRKHQKIEDPRFLYWADVLGLLVWEEMPSAYTFNDLTVHRLTRSWQEALDRDMSHPCIVAWVPFNESWGVPDLPDVPAQRHFVEGIYHLTKTLDPTRPVIGNDGWESVITDIIAIHDYEADPAKLARRYTVDESTLGEMLRRERPGQRILILNETTHQGLPIMLTEFGGIACSRERGAWGYSRVRTSSDFAARYAALLETVRSLPLLAGFCYTQFTDTYQEANGLLYMDRTPKFPIAEIAIATRGAQTDAERRIESRWRQRLYSLQRRQPQAAQDAPTP